MSGLFHSSRGWMWVWMIDGFDKMVFHLAMSSMPGNTWMKFFRINGWDEDHNNFQHLSIDLPEFQTACLATMFCRVLTGRDFHKGRYQNTQQLKDCSAAFATITKAQLYKISHKTWRCILLCYEKDFSTNFLDMWLASVPIKVNILKPVYVLDIIILLFYFLIVIKTVDLRS